MICHLAILQEGDFGTSDFFKNHRKSEFRLSYQGFDRINLKPENLNFFLKKFGFDSREKFSDR